MTIKDTVKQALVNVRGNDALTLSEISFEVVLVEVGQSIVIEANQAIVKVSHTSEQIRRALRDLKHVKRVNGRYIVKGRRVPVKAS